MRILLFASLLLLTAGCTTSIISVAGREPRDWRFIQSVGGISLGTPSRERDGKVRLPLRCNVSGTEVITTRPSTLNSALICDPPVVQVESGRVLLTLRTTLAGDRRLSTRCPDANLGALPPGRYAVDYRDPDGARHPLGSIRVPH